MRLKVAAFIADRYAYYKERKVLLKRQDLNYINPYLDDLHLSTEERRFIWWSRRVRRWYRVVLYGSVAIALGVFIHYSVALSQARQVAESHVRSLSEARSTLDKQLKAVDSLKNSLSAEQLTNEKLLQENADKNERLQLTRQELIELTAQLELANEKLEAQNKQVTKQNVQLEQKYASLKKDQQEKERQFAILQDSKKGINATAEAIYLSAEAEVALNKQDKRLAFRLAQEAYRKDKNNKRAIRVLQALEKPSTSYPYRDQPANYSPPKAIIQKLKRQYGSLSSSERARYKIN